MQRINLVCRRIFLTKDDILAVESFCQKIQTKQDKEGSRDVRRNDVGDHRILNGMIGKLGEVGASKLFGGTVDFRVWETGRRGLDQFEPDLQNPKSPYRFHVKTCHIKHTVRDGTNTYPLLTASWTIDQSDPVLHYPKKDDILVLMFASNKGSVHSLGWVKATEVKDLWKPCVTATLSHKRALYIEDIWSKVKQTSHLS